METEKRKYALPFNNLGEKMPIPNHCIECDKPTFDIICDNCKEKDDKEDE